MKRVLLVLGFMSVSVLTMAQGVTTSTMNGKITDKEGIALPGATVIAVHTPTGTEYGVVTNIDGYFYFPTVRVGGPYAITVSFVGYSTLKRENIFLALGEKRSVDLELAESSQTLDEIIVTATIDDIINSNRTGASTRVNEEILANNPSISRAISDFIRLTPQAAGGIGNGGTSISGRNSRYNNITIDGAVNNDAFGLNADGQPGSNAGTEPISLDVIKEVSIQVAPYDVTQGSFTGGGINAVTRGGTNEIEGSAYYFTRNENITGKTIGDDPQKQAPFFNKQYGARVGGPIIKNKLFAFVSVELDKAETPFTVNLVDQSTLDNYAGNVPSNISNISTETAQSVRDYLINNYNYDPGSYAPFTPTTESTKLFGRIDWNINNNHQLTFRHSYVKALQDNISRNQNFLQFTNNGYVADYLSNSTILELTSRLSDNISNKLTLGYSSVDNFRNIEDQTSEKMFPHAEIDLTDGTTIVAGTQRSSVGNELYQDIIQFTNNLTIFKSNHVLTIGTHNEHFKIKNSFVNRYNGHYEYDGIANFFNNTTAGSNGRFRMAYSLDYFNDRFKAVELRFLQTGFYLQDEWEATTNLSVTGGIRLDIPFFLDDPNHNVNFENDFGFDTRELPSGELLWSPRIGFNYDLKGDQSIQIRGGAGIFTGRIPFVWVSNQYTNSGASLGFVSVRGTAGTIPLALDGNRTLEYYYANLLGVGVDDPLVAQAIQTSIDGATGASEINVMDKDYKLPQIFRMNLAVDAKLPYGFIGSLEGIYSNGINETKYENINLEQPTVVLPFENDRPRQASVLVNPNFGNVLLITNTNEGYQFSITGNLSKNWSDKLVSFVAYNYGVSKDVNSGTHTTALSGWEYNPTPGYSNNSDVSYSQWDLRHRVVGNLNYTQKWSSLTSTTLGLYYNGQSGAPFTYMVNGDLNNDGSRGNDQAYIPANQSEIILEPNSASDTRTPDQIWAELNAFIERDDYLKENRGKIAERNGARTPWTNLFDIRLMQEFKVDIKGKANRIQLTLDIENLGNLVNKDWGRSYVVNFGAYNLLTYRSLEAGTNKVRYRYSDRPEAWNVNNSASVWRMQIGFRYIFGN